MLHYITVESGIDAFSFLGGGLQTQLQSCAQTLMLFFNGSHLLICFQTEQLVDQQVLISRLCGDLVTFRGSSSRASVEAGASGNTDKRPHSVPLIRYSCGYGPPRRVGSCNAVRVLK